MDKIIHYIVMGVSASGKSLIAQKIADKFDMNFIDGDDFHPEANIKKMKEGFPLNDNDRHPWLETINSYLSKQEKATVCACSALKEAYRKILSAGIEDHLKFIYLKGDFHTIEQRIKARSQHFMPSHLLQSQFDTLEEPNGAIIVDIQLNPDEILEQLTLIIS